MNIYRVFTRLHNDFTIVGVLCFVVVGVYACAEVEHFTVK